MEAIIEKDKELSKPINTSYNSYINACELHKPLNHDYNLEIFKDAISKMRRLKESEIINDKQFSDIIIMIATNFIENEIEWRVNYRINKTICAFFDK